MPITLQNFHSAAQQLGNDTTLRLREDGSGVAVSGWQRFQVSVSDLFRSKNEINASKSLALSVFFDAIKRAQGGDMEVLAEQSFAESASLLTSRAVISTLDTLNKHGGPHWLTNEQAIAKITHPTGEMLQDAITTVMDKAQQNGLTQKTCQALKSSYESGRRDSLVTAVANALRDAARIRDANGGISIRPLPATEVTGIAKQTVEKEISHKVNRALYDQFRAEQSVTPALDAAATDPNHNDIADLLATPEARAALEKFENDFVTGADGLLSLQALADMRQRRIDAVAAQQPEKLASLAELDLPDDDPAANHLIETCLVSPAPMGPAYFSALESAAKEIGDTFDTRQKQTPGQQITAFLALGSSLCAQIDACNAGEDAKTFIDLSVDLFVSRCPGVTLDAIMRWTMDEQYAGKTVRTPINDVSWGIHRNGIETPKNGAAIAARFLFDRFADLARFYLRPTPKDD